MLRTRTERGKQRAVGGFGYVLSWRRRCRARRPLRLAGRLLGQPRCRRRPAQAHRNTPARDLRRSCSSAAAVHNRRLRPWTRWLRALAGRACRSVSAGRWPYRGRGSLRQNANAQAPQHGQPRKEGAGVTEAAEEGCDARQDGQDEEAEAEEEDRAREVAAAGSDRAPSPAWGAQRLSLLQAGRWTRNRRACGVRKNGRGDGRAAAGRSARVPAPGRVRRRSGADDLRTALRT